MNIFPKLKIMSLTNNILQKKNQINNYIKLYSYE